MIVRKDIWGAIHFGLETHVYKPKGKKDPRAGLGNYLFVVEPGIARFYASDGHRAVKFTLEIEHDMQPGEYVIPRYRYTVPKGDCSLDLNDLIPADEDMQLHHLPRLFDKEAAAARANERVFHAAYANASYLRDAFETCDLISKDETVGAEIFKGPGDLDPLYICRKAPSFSAEVLVMPIRR